MAKYHYCYLKFDVGTPMDRHTKIMIPDFDVEMEFVDGGKYSSHSILKKIAEYKLKDLIECYLNDNRELPTPNDEETLMEKYDETPFWIHVEV